MLKVGQKVTFLSKEELQRKGKVLSDGDIAYEYKEDNYPHNLLMLSGDMMEEACGKTVTVSSVTLEKTFTFKESVYMYLYAEWMLKKDPSFTTKKDKKG